MSRHQFLPVVLLYSLGHGDYLKHPPCGCEEYYISFHIKRENMTLCWGEQFGLDGCWMPDINDSCPEDGQLCQLRLPTPSITSFDIWASQSKHHHGSGSNASKSERWHAARNMMCIGAVLIAVNIYFSCQCCCYMWSTLFEFCFHYEENFCQRQRFKFWRLLFSFNKTVMFFLFCYLYFWKDHITRKVPATLVKFLLLESGVMWFMNMLFYNFVELDREIIKGSREAHSLLKAVFGRKQADQSKARGKQYNNTQMYKTFHRICNWGRPSSAEREVIEDLMEEQLLSLCPCVHYGMVSLEQYLFVFTLFHLVVVIACLIIQPSEDSPLSAFKDYCMFPLGVLTGEKMMLLFTGFIPWWNEWYKASHKKSVCGCLPGGTCLALLGLFINFLDFGMVFYSILDDCFGKMDNIFGDKQHQFLFTMSMSIVDAAFDFISLYGSAPASSARAYLRGESASESGSDSCSGSA